MLFRSQREPNENKSTDLPVGISGPIVRLRSGAKVHDCSLSVSIPRFGQAPKRSSVYIGTENTYTVEKYQAALEKAILMRSKAEAVYQRAATKAKRAEGEWLLARRSKRPAAKK